MEPGVPDDGGVSVRIAVPVEYPEVTAFYRTQGYATEPGSDETVFVAEVDGRIVGAVRLAVEQGVRLLRGMFIDDAHQRRGIGSRLLRALVDSLGHEPCYCLSLEHLDSYYNAVGFERCDESRLPAFLQERARTYRARGYPIVCIERRPPLSNHLPSNVG